METKTKLTSINCDHNQKLAEINSGISVENIMTAQAEIKVPLDC
jgi:hypothetical protein